MRLLPAPVDATVLTAQLGTVVVRRLEVYAFAVHVNPGKNSSGTKYAHTMDEVSAILAPTLEKLSAALGAPVAQLVVDPLRIVERYNYLVKMGGIARAPVADREQVLRSFELVCDVARDYRLGVVVRSRDMSSFAETTDAARAGPPLFGNFLYRLAGTPALDLFAGTAFKGETAGAEYFLPAADGRPRGAVYKHPCNPKSPSERAQDSYGYADMAGRALANAGIDSALLGGLDNLDATVAVHAAFDAAGDADTKRYESFLSALAAFGTTGEAAAAIEASCGRVWPNAAACVLGIIHVQAGGAASNSEANFNHIVNLLARADVDEGDDEVDDDDDGGQEERSQ
jgi:hypothetical protein